MTRFFIDKTRYFSENFEDSVSFGFQKKLPADFENFSRMMFQFVLVEIYPVHFGFNCIFVLRRCIYCRGYAK